MRTIIKTVSASALLAVMSGAATAQSSTTTLPTLASTYYSWMSSDVQGAWARGFKGKGATITVVDDFRSQWGNYGNLGDGVRLLRHGEWTLKQAGMIAPQATMRAHDYTSGRTVSLARGLNVLNLSYGMYARDGYSSVRWSAQESSIIGYARDGKAIAVKAAGNDGVAVGAATADGQKDYLNVALTGQKTAILVGALNTNGAVDRKATLASYSNFAGSDPRVQAQFLVVGVRGDMTGLYGTSFAAPIVSGYAAVLGSKFTKATPAQITNQLLNTARKDTLLNYQASIHGRGEASLSRAIAPTSIR